VATVLAVRTAAMLASRATVALALLAGATLAGGCETNAQRSAKLEKERLAHPVAVQKGLTVARQSKLIQVVGTEVVHGPSGTAAVVVLRNVSSRALRDAPIAITVTAGGSNSSGGSSSSSSSARYQNNAPGLDPSLTSVALLQPGAQTVWIDDQVQVSGTPLAGSARVGEAQTVTGQMPRLSVAGVHTFDEPGSGEGAAGTVVNHSTVSQQEVVVYVLARRAGRVVAAGRAVLPELAAGQSAAFQAYLIGSPRGATLEASAPATTVR
jgi:hypothetical protein